MVEMDERLYREDCIFGSEYLVSTSLGQHLTANFNSNVSKEFVKMQLQNVPINNFKCQLQDLITVENCKLLNADYKNNYGVTKKMSVRKRSKNYTL